VYAIRGCLSEDFSIGVIGTGNVGKSTLLDAAYGFDTNPSFTVRTQDITPYYQRHTEKLHFLDFPHANSITSLHRDIVQTGSKFLDVAIVIFDVNNVDQDEKALIQDLHRLNLLDYIICLNCSDQLVQQRKRRGRGRPVSSELGIVSCTKEQMNTWRRQHAEQLKVPESKVKMCSFDPKDCTWEQAQEVGVIGFEWVRDEWVSAMLKAHTQLTDEEIQWVAEYDDAAETSASESP